MSVPLCLRSPLEREKAINLACVITICRFEDDDNASKLKTEQISIKNEHDMKSRFGHAWKEAKEG